MGGEPIYLLGFTLKDGSRYFWGSNANPITKRGSNYDLRRALDWLSWYERTWPGRVQLVDGWSGPVYDVFKTVTCDELLERFECQSSGTPEQNSEPNGGDVLAEERLRSDGDGPVSWLL